MITYFYTAENKHSKRAQFEIVNYDLPDNLNNYAVRFDGIDYKIIYIKDIFNIVFSTQYKVSERHCIIEKI